MRERAWTRDGFGEANVFPGVGWAKRRNKGIKAQRQRGGGSVENREEIVSFSASECFREANEFRGRYRLLMGGAGSGKSRNVATDALSKLLHPQNAGANLLVVRRTLRSHRNSTFAEFQSVIYSAFGQRARQLFDIRRGEMLIRCRNTGNSILFAGLHGGDMAERLKSIRPAEGQLTWIWCEEATEISAGEFEILDDRLRGELPEGLYYQITLSFNPVSSNHWLKKRFFQGEADEDRFLHHSSYRDNPFIDPAFHRRMERRRQYDPEGYRVYGLGEWGERHSAQILSRYRVEDCPRDLGAYDAMAMGMDFGFNHNNAVLLLGLGDGKIFICDELIRAGVEGEEVARAMEGRFPRELILWCDSASPERIRQLRRLGWRARPVKKEPGSVLAQIDYLRSREIIIHPRCTHTLEEMENWRWLEQRSSGELLDEPRSGNDDAMAALRYGVEGWRAPPSIGF